MAPKPKPTTGASSPCTTPLAQPLETAPLSLPLHPEIAVSPRPRPPAMAAVAPLTPPPPPLPRPGATVQPPQVSRVVSPEAASQLYWATQPRPVSGGQMYQFRLASLRAGELYTRASPQRYQAQWQGATTSPSHPDWQALLRREAAIMARAQGPNRLTVVVGDSLALWLPSETLPRDRFWLNQSISGETTTHLLQRLPYFAQTRPDTIHLMVGINDLRQGATEATVARNMHRILAQLRQQHPQARLVVYSILPTRLDSLPSDRIRRVNGQLAYLASQQGATFIDLQPTFSDAQGQLRREFTTDGLHLSRQGYQAWQSFLISY